LFQIKRFLLCITLLLLVIFVHCTAFADNYTYVTPQDYGAISNDAIDDTIAFKTSIATGLPVYVPPGLYLISDTLQLQNSIIFDGKIKMTNYRKNCLEIKNKVNEKTLFIVDPDIDGGWGGAGCPINFGDNGFYIGDKGHAIAVLSSTNIAVLGGNLSNLGGDGIFLGIDTNVSDSDENYSPTNISVDGTTINNTNRLNICIEAGVNCNFRNISGYKHNNFVAGIDIEPNSARPNATINNILFNGCYIVSDGSSVSDDPISQYGLNVPGKAEPFQIDCVSVDVPHTWGSITVKNSTFVAANCFAVRCLGESNLDYFTDVLTFENCKFESNYGGFVLWGKRNIIVKDCDINLSKDAYKESTILSKADSEGKYNCEVNIDNLNYTSEGNNRLHIYQIGRITVKDSKIATLTANKCENIKVENCIQ